MKPIIPQTSSYVLYKDTNVSFLLSDLAVIKPVSSNDNKANSWFNILYPEYNATIYCSFLPIKQENFRKALEDSYQLAYSHAVRADGIGQDSYANELHKTYGILYDIDGQVAVPIQFFLTDSISNFFRGSLYYDKEVDMDSVKLITEYLRSDIIKLMETLEWQH